MQARLNNEGGGGFRSHFQHQSSFGQSPFLRGDISRVPGSGWQPEIENEEEVQERKDEFLEHPLYKTLEIYDSELNEFIEEKMSR